MTQAPNPFKHIYNSAAWKKLRLHVLMSEPLCRICASQGKATPARHVDHIVPLSKGGDAFDAMNCQPLCIPHHSLKTQADEGAHPHWGASVDGAPLDPAHHWR